MILLPTVIHEVALRLEGDDFFFPEHKEIYESLLKLSENGKAIDDVTLRNALRHIPPLTISKIINSVPHAGHVEWYADIVKAKARLRRIIHGCTRAITEAYDELPAEDILATIDSVIQERTAAETAKPIHEIWSDVIAELEECMRAGRSPALLSGMPEADRLGFVFAPGELTILAARTSNGKTSLATQIAMHHARHARPVLFVSLEMRGQQLASRPLMSKANVNFQSVRTHGVTQADLDDLQQAKEDYGEVPLYIWSPGRVKASAIRAMAAAAKKNRGIVLVVVDYTAWILPDDVRAQKRDQVGECIKAMRAMGQLLGVPVILLHQLNREGDGEEPGLTNLRDSGAAEEDADMVALLHPIEVNEGEPPRTKLIIAKNRQGSRGALELIWQPHQTRFESQQTF